MVIKNHHHYQAMLRQMSNSCNIMIFPAAIILVFLFGIFSEATAENLPDNSATKNTQSERSKSIVEGSALEPSLLESEPVEDDISVVAEEDDKSGAETKLPAVVDSPSPASSASSSAVAADLPLEYNTALLRGLKKVSAETSSFEARLDKKVNFGTLTITLKKCHKSKPEDRPENAALLLIEDNKPKEEPIVVFSGWMFSSSPAISALEHPVYDIAIIECGYNDQRSSDNNQR